MHFSTSRLPNVLVEKMLNRKKVYLLVIICIFPSGMTANFNRNSYLSEWITHNKSSNNRNVGEKYKANGLSHAGFKCKYNYIAENKLAPKFVGRAQARFIDLRTNNTTKDNEMEAPAAKFSIFNLLSDDEEEEEEGDQDKVSSDDESVTDEEVEEDDGYDDYNFFGQEQEISADKQEGTKEESFLKQYHRHTFRMHHWVLPLLMAYKLKFFMVIPLLLGSLVLLIGTTAIAGFFFALFAAALGIHVKTHEH